MIKFTYRGLREALRCFYNNGKYSKRGPWVVAKGGYDLTFTVAYNGLTVIECVDKSIGCGVNINLDDEVKIYQIVLEEYKELREYNRVISVGIDLYKNTNMDIVFYPGGHIEIENIDFNEPSPYDKLDFARLIDKLEDRSNKDDWAEGYIKILNNGIDYIVNHYYHIISPSKLDWRDDNETKEFLQKHDCMINNLAEMSDLLLIKAIGHLKTYCFNPYTEELCRRAKLLKRYNNYYFYHSDESNGIVPLIYTAGRKLNINGQYIRESFPRFMSLYEYLNRYKSSDFDIYDNHITDSFIHYDALQSRDIDKSSLYKKFFDTFTSKVLLVKKREGNHIVANFSEVILNNKSYFENMSKNWDFDAKLESDESYFCKEWIEELNIWFRGNIPRSQYDNIKKFINILED